MECGYHHDIGFLPYSPLRGGSLSGKYRDPDSVPEKSRLKIFPAFVQRYLGSPNEASVNAYCGIAEEAGLTPAELSLSRGCIIENM